MALVDVRARIVQRAIESVTNRGNWDYSEGSDRLDFLSYAPGAMPGRVRTDCSGAVTKDYYDAGARFDPNGYPTWHTPGARFTGTLLAHGRRLPGPLSSIGADLCVIGPGTGWHVVMVVEGGRPDPVVVSHGQQGEPWMGPLSVDLRWPKTFLRYDTTGTGSVAPVGVRDLFWRKPIPMRGHDVDALRIKLGLQGPKQHGGYFGIGTDRAVRQAQRRHGLQVDGVVGEATRRALGL